MPFCKGELVAGLTDFAVAQQVGVHPNTVSKWRVYDGAFRVALNLRRAELLSGNADAVREQLAVGPRLARHGDDAPITDEERETAYLRLQALTAETQEDDQTVPDRDLLASARTHESP